ncbi:MAG: biotin--[acetyl-CoA-carboxylase] ligase [Muribaculaceae bacterium]|nr:biotin--[acetyl-CoA-carboxylase] ligase [Muribaculaceae bacterium]
MTEPEICWEPEIPSTNSALKERMAALPHGYTLAAVSQTAGRGQRGNRWEAAPGRNLTFSMLLRPDGIRPAEQFYISEAVALGVADVLAPLLPAGQEIKVKWPNDIYVDDRKICGILIENTLAGVDRIAASVAGIGININQEEFHSDAPNPVSLRQITGRNYPLEPLLRDVACRILRNLEEAEAPERRAGLHNRYVGSLWRGTGEHPFALHDGTLFRASIAAVAPDGQLTLRHTDGALTRHYFKEVSFILDQKG